MKEISVYFKYFDYENIGYDCEYLSDEIRSYYDLDKKTEIDTSCFEISEELGRIFPLPIYLEVDERLTRKEIKEIIKSEIKSEFGFDIPETEYWYECEWKDN